MSDVSAVSLNNIRTAQIQTEYQMRVLLMRRNVMQQQGEMAIKLIQSATLPEYQGKNLDVRA